MACSLRLAAADPQPLSPAASTAPAALSPAASAVTSPASPAASAAPQSASPAAAAATSPLSPAAAAVAPTAAPTATAIPTAIPSATPVPVLAAGGPAVPGVPAGGFTVLTASGQAPAPIVHLHWSAAEPGDFLIKGYRLFRSEAGKDQPQRRSAAGGGDGLLGQSLDDAVSIGAIYDYAVEAVDVKGQAGPRSAAFHVDLSHLPADQIAPRPPAGLTAQSLRETVKLQWQAAPAWVAPVSGYKLFRVGADEAQDPQLVTQLAGTAFEETPPARAKDFIYSLITVDAAGRQSPSSLTVSARATGAVAPSAPVGLTCDAKVERVTLSWSAASPGTSPVTAYLLRRREEHSEKWKTIALMPVSTTTHADNVEGDQGYIYSLAAVDSEGLTGTAVYIGASPTAKPWDKTLMILMPTAYANNKYTDSGVDLNVLFDFYVGSLYESYTNAESGFTKNGLLQPLQIGTITEDLKYSFLNDRGLVPGIAVGMYLAELIPFGNPGTGQSVGVSSESGGISSLGNVYGVVSKRFIPGEPRAAAHLGVMLGKLADDLTTDPSPVDWRPTIRHLLPGGDIPMLLDHFVDPKQDALVGQSSDMLLAGLQVPFTLPVFGRWKTGLRLEVMLPLADTAEYSPNTLDAQGKTPAQILPMMTNIHIDNLPLFGFEFSFFEYAGGYQVIAFYHIPDFNWSW